MKLSLAVTLAFFTSSASGQVPSLTPDNYDKLTGGKTVFIKFFAPWCGHCKKMAPDWEKLSSEWMGSEVGLVAEVDCTAEGQPLCEENEVRGYPTLKWGDPTDLEDYQGGRDYESLKEFAEENLKPVCGPSNIDVCDDEEKSQIEKFLKMSEDELDKAIDDMEAEIEKAENDFEAFSETLETQYREAMEAKDAAVEAVESLGLGLMKAVRASFGADEKDEL